MTTPAEQAQAQAALRLQEVLRPYIAHLGLLIRNNPQQGIAGILARPDLTNALGSGLGTAQEAAIHSVAAGWNHTDMTTRQHLINDVSKAYDDAAGNLAHAVTAAWHSVPDAQPFVPGVSTPGDTPALDVAAQRARAAQEAAARVARAIGLRNTLSAAVAVSASQTESVIDAARQDALVSGKTYVKTWRSRRIPGVTCAWCWALDGVTVPLEEQFPHPEHIHGRKPPRIWRGVLHGPPLHPNCQCWLEVSEEEAAPDLTPIAVGPPPEQPPQFVSSTDIRAMPEERYQGLVSFLSAALHELAHVIRKLLGIGSTP